MLLQLVVSENLVADATGGVLAAVFSQGFSRVHNSSTSRSSPAAVKQPNRWHSCDSGQVSREAATTRRLRAGPGHSLSKATGEFEMKPRADCDRDW